MSSLDYDNVFSNSLQEGPVYGKIPYEFVRLRQCFFQTDSRRGYCLRAGGSFIISDFLIILHAANHFKKICFNPCLLYH